MTENQAMSPPQWDYSHPSSVPRTQPLSRLCISFLPLPPAHEAPVTSILSRLSAPQADHRSGVIVAARPCPQAM